MQIHVCFCSGCAVTWLRQAFLRAVPGLLLCPSPVSGDAELAVAAHLGQLTVDVQGSHSSRPESPDSKSSGNWGPHLIVTSRISLSSWRSRLLAWCPGLKLICLSLGGKGVSSRKGRHLRDCIAHGTVNICLTTYSALRARPNRYREIQWSVIVFDHVSYFDYRLIYNVFAWVADSVLRFDELRPFRRIPDDFIHRRWTFVNLTHSWYMIFGLIQFSQPITLHYWVLIPISGIPLTTAPIQPFSLRISLTLTPLSYETRWLRFCCIFWQTIE